MHATAAVPAAASRRLAASLLEAQLVRLARAGAILERRLGPGLLEVSAHCLCRRLGFVRLGDYLTERLGMSLRRCQSIVWLERALRNLPAVAAAFDAGSLPISKVRVVAAAATPETQDLWLARAQHMTVRDLESAARAARQAEPRDVAGPETRDQTGSVETDVASPEEEPGLLISFEAPGRACALWHWALEFVRCVAGRQEPAWSCAEYLAAEFLSGCPDAESADDAGACPGNPDGVAAVAGPTAPSGTPAAGPPRHPPSRSAISDEQVWPRAIAAVRDALRPLGSAADLDSILSGSPPSVPEGSEPDPWDLDGRLRGLVRLRQSLAWRQGRLLAAVASYDLYRDLGFESPGDWCRCVLGMSRRRARYLVSLDRRLERLPLVADAYRRGLVSWCQARLLVRVARVGTESRWVRYARRVTVRRLEDVITACAVDEAAPALGSDIRTSRDGAPLPPPDPPPARHTFAPPDAPADAPVLSSDARGPARHTSAPRDAEGGWTADQPGRHTFAPGPPAGGPVAAQPARHTFAREPCTHRIAFWVPLEVAAVWRRAVRACRRARGSHLRDWECLLIFIIEMRDAWQPHENAEWRRRYRTLDRDGWRCLAPGCTSRSHLNVHHLVFRSHRGSDDASNLVTLCVGHHRAGVHDNLIRCYGRAPDAIWWEFGIRPDGPPLVRYFGERIAGTAASAGGVAWADEAASAGAVASAGDPSAPPHARVQAARTEIGRRGDPPSRPPAQGEPLPWAGSGSRRPLAELRQEDAAPRAPGL